MLFQWKNKIRVAVAAGLLIAPLVGCGGNARADAQRITLLIQERESARDRALAGIEQMKQLVQARAVRNPVAFLALAAAGHAAAKKFEGDVAVGEVAFSLVYCAFNGEECLSMASDLQKLAAESGRLEREVGILNAELARLSGVR